MFTLTRQDLIRQKVNMKGYLSQLGTLVGRAISADELSSLEKAFAMRQEIQKSLSKPTRKFETVFADLNAEKFAKFVKLLKDLNSSKVYVWTRHTIDCGALALPSIESILQFDFSVIFEREGLVYFRTEDLKDMLSLDFDLSPEGVKKMIIETQGDNWTNAAYF